MICWWWYFVHFDTLKWSIKQELMMINIWTVSLQKSQDLTWFTKGKLLFMLHGKVIECGPGTIGSNNDVYIN